MWKYVAALLLFCSVLLNVNAASVEQARKHAVSSRSSANPRGFVNLGGDLYFFSDDDKTWDGALAACRALGMKLVTLDNAAKDNLILDYVLTLDPNFYWWTAGMRPANSRTWSWITTGQSFVYTHWMYDEPGTDYTKQGCMQTVFYWWPTEDRGWAEMDCNDIAWSYICEY